MTPDDVRARVAEIETTHRRGPGLFSWDEERAHAAEDALYFDVLRAIAEGAPNAADLAREALRTKDLDFPRWFA